MKSCSVPDCDRPSRERGMCHSHYTRWSRGGDISTPIAPPRAALIGVDLQQTRLVELINYDPLTGDFRWRHSTQATREGAIAGHLDAEGYRVIWIDGRSYRAHRLAFLYVLGRWPITAHIDHWNLDRANNSWENIREATPSQNKCNTRALSTNTSGAKGVDLHPKNGLWRARISIRGVRYNLGCFATVEDAADAYREAAVRLHGEFARTE